MAVRHPRAFVSGGSGGRGSAPRAPWWCRYYITLFYQTNSTSRFIRQKIMFNLEPIDAFAKKHKIKDVRKHEFTCATPARSCTVF